MLQASDGLRIFLFCASALFSVTLDLFSSSAISTAAFSFLKIDSLVSRGRGLPPTAVIREVMRVSMQSDQQCERNFGSSLCKEMWWDRISRGLYVHFMRVGRRGCHRLKNISFVWGERLDLIFMRGRPLCYYQLAHSSGPSDTCSNGGGTIASFS